MKKRMLLGLLAAAVLLFLPVTAQAASFPIESNLTETDPQPEIIWQRYFTPASAKVNGSDNCPYTVDDDRACEMGLYKSNPRAYRGYSENIEGFDNQPFGTTFYHILDMELNPGTGQHEGYYAWAGQVVDGNETMLWRDPNCVGGSPVACMGPCNQAYGDAVPVPNVPRGTKNGRGGLRPIPVPRAGNYDSVAGSIDLDWERATAQDIGDEAAYDINYAILAPGGGACPDATPADFTLLRTEPAGTLSTTVLLSDLGLAPGDEQCVTFAIRLNLSNYFGGASMTTKFLSSNGQAVYIGGGGLAAQIYDIKAVGIRQGAQVSWKTSLEDGVRGFYVTRAFTQDGPYSRVSDLIRAKGEPSAYTYLDNNVPAGARLQGNGVFYQIESIDIDDAVQTFGPVELEVPQAFPAGGGRILRPLK